MLVLLTIGRKCTLVTSHAAPWWVTAIMPTGQTDGRRPGRYIMLSAARVKIDWVKVLCPDRHKIGHLGDVLPSQALGSILKKLNPRQQATQEQNDLSWDERTHKRWNLNKLALYRTGGRLLTTDVSANFKVMWHKNLVKNQKSSPDKL